MIDRRTWLAMLVAVCSVGSAGADDATKRLAYERSVGRVWGHYENLPKLVDWCEQKFPDDYSRSKAELAKWRQRFASLHAQMDRRVTAILTTQGHGAPDALEREKANLRKLGERAIEETMARLPDGGAQSACVVLPLYITSDDANPEIKYAADLELIREHEDGGEHRSE